jgi:hypothetical protein
MTARAGRPPVAASGARPAGPPLRQPPSPGRPGTPRLSEVLPDIPVAGAPGPRDGFAQMLATLDAQLDRDLARPALPAPVPPVAPAAPRPAPAPLPRSMWALAAAVVATIAVVGSAALLIALHWRPTRSMAASSVPVAARGVPAAAEVTQAPAAAPGPLAQATGADALSPHAEATPAASPCTQVQTALGLCAALAPRTNPTTTPESLP